LTPDILSSPFCESNLSTLYSLACRPPLRTRRMQDLAMKEWEHRDDPVGHPLPLALDGYPQNHPVRTANSYIYELYSSVK